MNDSTQPTLPGAYCHETPRSPLRLPNLAVSTVTSVSVRSHSSYSEDISLRTRALPGRWNPAPTPTVVPSAYFNLRFSTPTLRNPSVFKVTPYATFRSEKPTSYATFRLQKQTPYATVRGGGLHDPRFCCAFTSDRDRPYKLSNTNYYTQTGDRSRRLCVLFLLFS